MCAECASELYETEYSKAAPMIFSEPQVHTSRASLITRWPSASYIALGSLFLTAFLCVASHSSAGASGAQSHMTSAAAVISVSAPASSHALLSNIASALSEGALLSEAFYTTVQLRQFFGASHVKWILNTDTDKYAQLLGAAYVPVLDKHPARLGITWIRLDSQQKKSVIGKAEAAVSLACSCALRVEDIDAVFGARNRSVAPDRRLEGTHAPVPRKPSDPLGNQIATYTIDTIGSHTSTLSVAFNPDGNITLIEARSRER
jgi:hypothetical protein